VLAKEKKDRNSNENIILKKKKKGSNWVTPVDVTEVLNFWGTKRHHVPTEGGGVLRKGSNPSYFHGKNNTDGRDLGAEALGGHLL